ncbi:MAG: EamA family transporter [Betaproteobacteria bacterium]|nr:EamA family transporter [Betaproteobacteria bacterium]
MIDLSLQRYAFFALIAAALFGASTPFAKLLLGNVPPLGLAGLLYLGSGLGLLAVHVLGRLSATGARGSKEARLSGQDYLWLAGAVVAGGVAGPVLLMWGLSGTGASEASLLLNLEGVVTTLVAAFLFREAVGGRVWTAAAMMLAAGLLLSWQPQADFKLSMHALAIVGACLCWALDNNLTRKISASDPVVLATIKGLVAGSFNLAVAFALGLHVPAAVILAGALALGFLGYGVSLVLFILALRHLGSARTAAHFSTAPFIGAAIAIFALGEPFTVSFGVALALMAGATGLVLTEQHAHEHTHEYMAHSHRHVHDEHHQHAHRGDEGPEPHAHWHEHPPMTHTHPHLPDLHHRHRH